MKQDWNIGAVLYEVPESPALVEVLCLNVTLVNHMNSTGVKVFKVFKVQT